MFNIAQPTFSSLSGMYLNQLNEHLELNSSNSVNVIERVKTCALRFFAAIPLLVLAIVDLGLYPLRVILPTSYSSLNLPCSIVTILHTTSCILSFGIVSLPKVNQVGNRALIDCGDHHFIKNLLKGYDQRPPEAQALFWVELSNKFDKETLCTFYYDHIGKYGLGKTFKYHSQASKDFIDYLSKNAFLELISHKNSFKPLIYNLYCYGDKDTRLKALELIEREVTAKPESIFAYLTSSYYPLMEKEVLTIYDRMLSSNPEKAQALNDRLLFDLAPSMALSNLWGFDIYSLPAKVKLAKMLLQKGADPHIEIAGKSAWQRGLQDDREIADYITKLREAKVRETLKETPIYSDLANHILSYGV